jgi:hypothetical protein
MPMTSMTTGATNAKPLQPIEQAAAKTGQVQRDLTVAEAELHLTNTVLKRALADPKKEGDVKKAVEQNSAIQEKVGDAAEELQEVTDLLHAEVSERERLEKELERRTPL